MSKKSDLIYMISKQITNKQEKSVVLALKKEHMDQWNRLENTEINSYAQSKLILSKVPRKYIAERTKSSISGVEKLQRIYRIINYI